MHRREGIFVFRAVSRKLCTLALKNLTDLSCHICSLQPLSYKVPQNFAYGYTNILACLQPSHVEVVFVVCLTDWSSTASPLQSSSENKRQLSQYSRISSTSLKRCKEAFRDVKKAMPGHLIYLLSILSLDCRRATVFVQDYGVLHLPGKLWFCGFLVNCTLKYQRPHIFS